LGLFQVLVVEVMEKIFNYAHAGRGAVLTSACGGLFTLPLLIGGAISLAVTEGEVERFA